MKGVLLNDACCDCCFSADFHRLRVHLRHWLGTVASTIADEPILLLACVGIPMCGLGVGLFKRLLRAKA